MTRITLYPINAVAGVWEDEPFDQTNLPAQILPDVSIENVSSMFTEDTFSWVHTAMGTRDLETLNNVKYAIVHRFSVPVNLDSGKADQDSAQLVNNVAACLRLIRPMRQSASMMVGNLQSDGRVQIQTFNHPVNLFDVPMAHRGFALRNRDVADLQAVIGEFQRAMRGQFWKFRMSVSFHDGGYFAVPYWKSRFALWCSAVEALFTSQNINHQGRLVATERIKWFLGENTSIFAPGDIPSFMPKSHYTVGEVVVDLCEVRNCIAHGDKIPDRFFQPLPNGYLGESGNIINVLHDALSFIIRTSLLRILKDNLLDHFADSQASDAYFGAASLTRSALTKAKHKMP